MKYISWLASLGWIADSAAVILVALCAATAYAVLRTSSRSRITRWPGSRIANWCIIAIIPWLATWFAPHHFTLSIHGVWALTGWLLLALLGFTLLVLLPLAVLLALTAWTMARLK